VLIQGVKVKSEISFWIGVAGLVLAVFSVLLTLALHCLANARANLILEIKDVLNVARKCESWDDKSEEKLFQYIGAVEDRLGRYSVKALVEIRNRAYEYWKVHLKMEGREEDFPYRTPFCTWRQFLRRELLGNCVGVYVD